MYSALAFRYARRIRLGATNAERPAASDSSTDSRGCESSADIAATTSISGNPAAIAAAIASLARTSHGTATLRMIRSSSSSWKAVWLSQIWYAAPVVIDGSSSSRALMLASTSVMRIAASGFRLSDPSASRSTRRSSASCNRSSRVSSRGRRRRATGSFAAADFLVARGTVVFFVTWASLAMPPRKGPNPVNQVLS